MIVEFMDQFADPQAGRQVNFSPHGNWKNVHTGPECLGFQRGTGLADQMTGYPAFIETYQQIQGLLLPAPPGALGVDVQNLHLTGNWIPGTVLATGP